MHLTTVLHNYTHVLLNSPSSCYGSVKPSFSPSLTYWISPLLLIYPIDPGIISLLRLQVSTLETQSDDTAIADNGTQHVEFMEWLKLQQ